MLKTVADRSKSKIVSDRKVKVLKIVADQSRSKIVADRSGQSVDVAED